MVGILSQEILVSHSDKVPALGSHQIGYANFAVGSGCQTYQNSVIGLSYACRAGSLDW